MSPSPTSTRYRAPTLTITHHGGMDIEELPKDQIAEIPFDPFTGLKSFVITNALSDLKAPKEIISPLAQNLPKLWDLFHHHGMSTLELNPIRMTPTAGAPDAGGLRLQMRLRPRRSAHEAPEPAQRPVRGGLLGLRAGDQPAAHLSGAVGRFRHQPNGTILAPTFGGGANSLVTEFLGDDAIISSDFGGNPPYEKMREVMRICLKHWLKQTNVLFIIGGKANNTDIFVTFRAMADALREYFSEHGPTPVYVVIGRGGPNLARGLLTFKDACECARPALSHLRLRFRDDRRGVLRPGGRPLDEERRARNARQETRVSA